MKTDFANLFVVAALIVHTSVAEDQPHQVRQRFLPGPSEHGASFSALRPGPGKDGGLFLQAWAGIGDKFPVKNQAGMTLFSVTVLDGDDDRLVMEITAEEAIQKLDVKRDQSKAVMVAGIRYEVAYPSVSVNSTEKTTTNQAMIMIFLRP